MGNVAILRALQPVVLNDSPDGGNGSGHDGQYLHADRDGDADHGVTFPQSAAWPLSIGSATLAWESPKYQQRRIRPWLHQTTGTTESYATT